MSDIERWLKQLDLGKYAALFVDNEIDVEILPELNESDFEKLEIPLGPRKKILRAIRERTAGESTGNPAKARREAVQTLPTGEAERRQLTVMFCDLVDSTALCANMDTEDYRDLLRAYQSAAAGAIHEHAGFIARYVGDGLKAYFGYPVARENDPERAVRAGLAVIDAVNALGTSMPLEVRVGIATGPVVVGDIVGEGASEEAAVLGETPNLAARLLAIAAPNSVALAPVTQALLHGRVETQALEAVKLKGISEPVAPYRAVRPRSLSEVSDSMLDTTPLVGRDVEVALIERAWRRARASEGQAVLLSGEPGLGKSRLLRAFQEGVAAASRIRVQWHCSSYFQTTANYPAVAQLKLTLGDDRLDALETLVRGYELDVDALVPPLALLLSIPLSERYAVPDWTPDVLKARLVQAQVELLLAAATRAPVLFVIEDLHWADPTTLEVLGEIIPAIRGQRVLMLMTARPEFNPPWADVPHAMTQRLSNLSRDETMALVRHIVKEHGVSEASLEQIVERSDGVPLFIEELTRSLLESNDEAVVPASLQDSLMARLDRLGATKALAQTASVIGRAFSLEVLTQLVDRPGDTVETELSELIDSNLVRRRAGGVYEFKHALIRDAAYGSLLRDRRVALHSQLAVALEQHQPALCESQPELLAYHIFAGKNPHKAAVYWQRAGERALSLSAYSEAISHLRHVVEALDLLEPADEAFEREIEAQSALAIAYHAAEGQASKNVETALLRARELCALTGNEERRFNVLLGLWRVYGGRAAWEASDKFNDELYELSLTLDNPALRVQAEMARGVRFLHEGRFVASRGHLEQAARLYESLPTSDFVQQTSLDPGVITYSRLSWVLWMLGSPNRAMQWNTRCLTHAQSLDHPSSLAMAHLFSSMLYILSGEDGQAGVQVRSAMQLAGEHGQAQWRTTAAILQGWSLAKEGDTTRGLAMLRENLNQYRANGTGVYQEWFLTLLAEARGDAGDIDGAYVSILEAARLREQRAGLGLWGAEICRVRARIDALRGETQAARNWLRRAMTIAQAQQSSTLQLKVALEGFSLAETAAIAPAAALASLKSIVGRFEQHIETPDLKAARAIVAMSEQDVQSE